MKAQLHIMRCLEEQSGTAEMTSPEERLPGVTSFTNFERGAYSVPNALWLLIMCVCVCVCVCLRAHMCVCHYLSVFVCVYVCRVGGDLSGWQSKES